MDILFFPFDCIRRLLGSPLPLHTFKNVFASVFAEISWNTVYFQFYVVKGIKFLLTQINVVPQPSNVILPYKSRTKWVWNIFQVKSRSHQLHPKTRLKICPLVGCICVLYDYKSENWKNIPYSSSLCCNTSPILCFSFRLIYAGKWKGHFGSLKSLYISKYLSCVTKLVFLPKIWWRVYVNTFATMHAYMCVLLLLPFTFHLVGFVGILHT